jgi:Asp-tRNA(Asn)/Glu-tRNA(Gln) amidotransferase A subunit family amidase
MADKSLTRKTARELAAMIKSRAVSPVEVLNAHLAVIARVNPKLNAIVTLAAEQANERARAVEAAVMRGERLGALAGLPVAIKDVTPTAGIRTTFGSPSTRITSPKRMPKRSVASKPLAPSWWRRPTRRNSRPAPTR